MTPTIQFFAGVPEALSDVRLRRNRSTGLQSVLMIFETLNALDRFNSYTSRFNKALLLTDDEGEISVEPSSVKFIFGGDEGDELQRVECKFEIDRDDHWQRFMRFMERYAATNGLEYGESSR